MRRVKKLLVILFIVAIYPMIHFAATHFYLTADTEIYDYIPQESDIVIEINSRNFLQEILYQKVYNEDYFNATLFPPEEKLGRRPIDLNIGMNVFSKVIIIREQWSESDVWLALLEYNDKTAFKKTLEREAPNSRVFFGNKFAVVHLNAKLEIEGLNDHLNKVAKGELKSFTERVDLSKVFDPTKEINVYLLHDAGTAHTKLIDGHLSYDFLPTAIEVEGEFTPVSGFEALPSIAYAMNDQSALSVRSSISLFNSLYWFGKNRIDDLPEYDQLAVDYDGVNVMLCDMKMDLPFAAKQFPKMEVRFDVSDSAEWQQFIAELQADEKLNLDTTAGMLSTNLGTFVKYRFEGNTFEVMREGSTNFFPAEDGKVYFDFRMDIDPLLDNTKLAIDEQNPPQNDFALPIANDVISDLKVMANVETMWYTMTLTNNNMVKAEGEVVMKNKQGSSFIECLRFGSLALDQLKGM